MTSFAELMSLSEVGLVRSFTMGGLLTLLNCCHLPRWDVIHRVICQGYQGCQVLMSSAEVGLLTSSAELGFVSFVDVALLTSLSSSSFVSILSMMNDVIWKCRESEANLSRTAK